MQVSLILRVKLTASENVQRKASPAPQQMNDANATSLPCPWISAPTQVLWVSNSCTVEMRLRLVQCTKPNGRQAVLEAEERLKLMRGN